MGFSITGAHNECLSEGCRAMALYAEIGRLKDTINRVMVCGNHIATHRHERWPEYQLDGLMRDQQCEHALRILGAGKDYDMWCCWSGMMQVRDELEKFADKNG